MLQRITWPKGKEYPLSHCFKLAEKCLGGPVRMVAAYGSRSPAAVVYWFRPTTQQKKEDQPNDQ